MAGAELLDSHVSLDQCKLAVDALHKHSQAEKQRQENQLLPGEEQHIWLVLAVKEIHHRQKVIPFKMCVLDLLTLG
jgi:ribosome biogenesis protein UTP30